ncbi:maleylpyruvate isomerase family mycothiol-dependent enzyme [Microlunatus sp. Gsoil 973]|jgi:maleylpyruvate isomerase|uniref:maleylpyruvate isomerase family mycothiol-dependent enzyme n=1 Tax=Microlunatus sp. Gsoil 973 TaxID=2672569 RepID=UPI0012B4CF6A|nr:maleylpyruvate isomerase family mycothiol-dependent enzyme [Microlunatus sp. Gsoil 973]QGN31953.1 maleylpyruvate isomerase family mycothiol-dependent enzyme [Microlunatus sp. Gsoil 973]
MTPQPAADQSSTTADPIAAVRALLAAANRRLLGDTIAVEDDSWHAASRLPGWTRAHVATHLARHAEAFARLANWAHTGAEQQMYPDNRDAAIEAGAGRDGLAIQTDLDTTAGLLAQEFDAVADAGAWQAVVRLRDGRDVRAGQLPAGRLAEVIIHHVDLDLGMTVDDIDVPTAEAVLDWCAFRQAGRSGYPPLTVVAESGRTYDFGPRRGGEPVVINGPANRLLGWVTCRSGSEGLDGPIPELPSFG